MHHYIASLFGPIFSKELMEMARRTRYYLARVVYGLGLLFVLLMIWESSQWLIRNMGPVRAMPIVANDFAMAIYSVQFAAVFIFVPLFLGGVICGEREERTLEQLFTTPLTNSQIIFGKLASRMAAVIGLMLCGLPVLAITFLFGGVDPGTMVRVFAVTLLAIIYAGAHAIYFSTVTKSALGALVRTYWWMAVWLIGLPLAARLVLVAMPRSIQPGLEQPFVAGLMMVNPIATFAIALNGPNLVRMFGFGGWWLIPAAFVLPTLWSLFLIWRAVRRLRADPIPFKWRLRIPLVGRLWRFFWRQIGRPFAWWHRIPMLPRLRASNPLWVRARQAAVYDREGYIRRIQRAGWYAAFFFLFLVAINSPPWRDHGEVSMGFLGPTWLAILLLTTLIAGNSLVGDRRRGFLELVLATPLSPREVVDGTALAIWEHIRRIYRLPWVLGGIFWLSGASLFYGVLFTMFTATLFLTLIVYHAVACSLTARTLAGALVATFLLPLTTLVGIGMAIGLFDYGHGPFLWIACAILLPATGLWVRRRLNAASIACFSTAVHVSLVSLFMCWTAGGRHMDYPGAAMHPGYMAMVTLDHADYNWFHHLPRIPVLFCYWTALIINIWWLRRWLIRRFDRIVERPERLIGSRKRARSDKSRQVTLSKST